ncbi:MAG: S-layer protein [Candidatus Micrarchaeota archaeon]
MKLLSDDEKMLSCVELKEDQINVLSSDRIQILKMLSSRPMYPAEIARMLKIQIQAVYYHIKILKDAELIKFSGYEEKQGAIAKTFSINSNAIAIVINEKGWKKYSPINRSIPKIISPFINHDIFDAKFVLGSPEPHGKYRARGSEFTVLELAMLFGNYAAFYPPIYLLDTQIQQKNLEENLILAGGPKVNTIVEKINSSLKIGFTLDMTRIYSKLSKKTYGGNVGLIELMQNPFDNSKSILTISGLNHAGTRAATLSLIKKLKEVEQGNSINSNILAKVVEGFDEDGDGIVDNVEILE